MRTRPLILFSVLSVLAMSGVAAIALYRLPAGATLPIHWDAAGRANGIASAGRALFMPVVLAAFFFILFALLPRMEPLQKRMVGSAGLLSICWSRLLALMGLTELRIAAPAFGLSLSPTVHLAGLGLFLIMVGNAMPKSRPGFFVGIRTPWAMVDTDNWIATHRLGARTMMAAGAMIVAAAVIPIGAEARQAIVILATVGAVVPPVVYSWWLWWRAAH